MKRVHKNLTALLLALAMLLSFAGCAPKDEIVATDITFRSDAPYSEETRNEAGEVIHSLVIYVYSKAVMENISETVGESLAKYAEGIRKLTEKNLVSEAQYKALIAALESQGRAVADELIAIIP